MNGWGDLCPPPPLIETYHEGVMCPPYARLYSSVFSLLQKPANVKAESWIVNGRVPKRRAKSDEAPWSTSRQPTARNRQIVMSSWAETLTTGCRRHGNAHLPGLKLLYDEGTCLLAYAACIVRCRSDRQWRSCNIIQTHYTVVCILEAVQDWDMFSLQQTINKKSYMIRLIGTTVDDLEWPFCS